MSLNVGHLINKLANRSLRMYSLVVRGESLCEDTPVLGAVITSAPVLGPIS